MSIEEAILEKVRTLPPEKQSELLDFAEFLQARLPTPKRPRGVCAAFGRSSGSTSRKKKSPNCAARCGRIFHEKTSRDVCGGG